MKASELRVGNYVKIQSENEVVKVNGELIHFLHDGMDECSIQPIPLTEEMVTEIISRNNLGFVIEYDRDEMCYYCVFCECFDGGGYRFEVKFIHQLQNLYHSLYNEELIIDLKTVKTKQK